MLRWSRSLSCADGERVGFHLEQPNFVQDARGNGNAEETYTFVCGSREPEEAAFYGATPAPPQSSTATSVEEVAESGRPAERSC